MAIYKSEVVILKSRSLAAMNENMELINAGQPISWEFYAQDARTYFDCDEYLRNVDEAIKDDELIGRLSVALGKQRLGRAAVGVKNDIDKAAAVVGRKAAEGAARGAAWLANAAAKAAEKAAEKLK